MTLQEDVYSSNRAFKEALLSSISDRRSISITAVSATTIFILLTLASAPAYSYQLLSGSLFYLDEGLITLTSLLYESSGALAVALTIIYSLLGGSAIYNITTLVAVNGRESIKNAGLLSPGLIAAGCAGCGAGVLSLLGFAGALALLPFQGNLIRLAGIALLVYFLAASGDPEKCEL